jgi:GNAT superfamily N-acetyltransferase
VRTNAGRYESWPALVELDKAAFVEHLDGLMDVYSTAMRVPAFQLPGRRAVMDAHVLNPAFRAVAATGPASVLGGTRNAEAVIAFAYGFHGRRGQWWHDLVRSALTVASGSGIAGAWLDDSFEVAEVHVRPEFQKRGIGRRMLYRLTAGLPERTAVLSTMDDDTPARHLYGSLGFTDLLTGYQFTGVPESYAVMGAALPLLSAGPGGTGLPAGRPPSPRY